MQVFTCLRVGFASLSILALVSCDEGASFGQGNFQAQYSGARDALEKGRYDQASKAYTRLLPVSGSLAPRIQLELAHSYLRGGNFAAAAKEARGLSSNQSGDARAAALTVQATADHELGLKALAKGDTKTGKLLLRQADKAMASVLKSHPKMDPLGALAGRRASIAVRLKAL
ncbi:hypothetical protein [Ascidiaceihabitans sp.]|uniref:hypothetical protein n=1 Tax=Ascidiaceihabitans sp. TaxID=1872644 RepID=UPI003298255B